MKNEVVKLRNQIVKYRRLFFLAIFLWIVFYLSGFLTGWWVVKGKLGSFPSPDSKTKLLVVAPHPDDETVIAGGLIQRVLEKGGSVRIIYLTSGDGSRTTVAFDNKKIDLNPADFISLGESRIKEASSATQILGLKKSEVYFLGFPDQGLTGVYQKNYSKSDGNFTSPTTKVDHVPYPECFHPGETYLGENLVNDVKGIIQDYSPNIVIVGHPRDSHPDHRISYLLIERLRSDLGAKFVIFSSLTHFRGFPNPGGYLFPPKKLFGGDWLSLELTTQEVILNKKAIEAHKSQYEKPEDKLLFDRLTSRNQLFEME
ncbi:MAG: PIG-L family deacetylase, partial [Candidatus Woesebacteria bacterium]|nr:PIG-L family deacetylase [Candidatus Woesebacteria bacterium]